MYGRFIVQLMYATPHLFPVDMSIIYITYIYNKRYESTFIQDNQILPFYPLPESKIKSKKTRFPKNINFSVASSLLVIEFVIDIIGRMLGFLRL